MNDIYTTVTFYFYFFKLLKRPTRIQSFTIFFFQRAYTYIG